MIWYEILPRILNMSLTASVIILFVIVCRLLLKRAPKVYSYILWGVVIFRLICPISLSAPMSLLGMFQTPVVALSTKNVGEQVGEAKDVLVGKTSVVEYIPAVIVHNEYPEIALPITGEEGVVGHIVNESLPKGEEQLVADPLEIPITMATYLWLLGIIVMLGSGVVSYIGIRRQLIGALCIEKNIFVADHISTPFVLGLINPKIYLPSAMEENAYKYVILHEKYHIRRGDTVIKMLAYFALCIHWFNPLVWIAFHLFVKDMEMSCDEAVINKLGEAIRKDYASSILEFATGQKVLFGAPLAFGEGEPEGRIRNLSKWKKPTIIVTVVAMIVCVLVVILGIFNPMEPKDSLQVEEKEENVENLIDKKEGDIAVENNSVAEIQEIGEDELLCNGLVLTSQPDPDKISIHVQPSVIRSYITYYYIPGEEEQKWLEDYMNKLPSEGEPFSRRWEGKKETGYRILWQGKEYMVFEGGYLYYTYDDAEKGAMEYMVEEPKLCDYVQVMLQEELGYNLYKTEEIQNIASAKLEVCDFFTNYAQYSQTITDKDTLKQLESWFTNAQYIYGGVDCGNQYACLELTLENGKVIPISVATDSCTNIGINGIYYKYFPSGSQDSRAFFELFDEIPWEHQ